MPVAQDPAIWISESDVVSMMGMGEAIAALETGLQAEAQGDAPVLGYPGGVVGHRRLHLDRAAHGIDHARELQQ